MARRKPITTKKISKVIKKQISRRIKNNRNLKRFKRKIIKYFKKINSDLKTEWSYLKKLGKKYSSFFQIDSKKEKTVRIKKSHGVIFSKRITKKKLVRSLKKISGLLTSKYKRKRYFNQLKKNGKLKAILFVEFTKDVWKQVSQELVEIVTPVQTKKIKPKTKKSRRGRKRDSWFKKLSKYLKKNQPILPKIGNFLKQYGAYIFMSLFTSAAILGSAYGLYVFVFEDLPSVEDLATRDQIVTTRILDRNGELLFRIYEDENRTLVPLSAIPQHVIDATIAIEDQNFYNHHGFSVKGITRAFMANLQGRPIQGGSTITQQLVKNRLLSSERTVRRKIREVILSVLVDGTFTKDEVLEMYFNQVAYGGATYGIEEAAQTYFGKSASQLSIAEGAMLAGLPAAPSVYSPFGPQPELGYARQDEVLRRMVEDQYLTEEDAGKARSEILRFRPNVIDIKAPHFVMYIKRILAEQYGEQAVNQGGLEVRTTLDLALQEETQQVITDELNILARLNVNNGASLVTNPQTGEILAMVGSKDYFDFENDGQVNVTLRPRQPGSSIKPLTYAVALEQGKTPSSVIDDSPITYQVAGSKPYSPKNYDGKYHGRVTIRQALASSYNIPAVKTLAEVGVQTVIDKGEAMGITTWQDRKRFGLSLTLGGGEVLMTDIAQVYGTFANSGYTVELNPILEVKNARGETLYKNSCALNSINCRETRNIDPRVAYQINDILSDNQARTPAFGPQSVLNIPGQQVAVKTGTTNNLRDNWTIGYTQDRLVAVWVGNNDNQPMSYVASGITGASPIWNKITRMLLDENQPHSFVPPDGLIKVSICSQTGTLSCSSCPTNKDAYFVPGTEPTIACNPAYFQPRTSTDQGISPDRNRILEGFLINSD